MPKAIVVGDGGPNRGRSSKAAKRSERGWFVRLVSRSPKDTVAVTLAVVATVAILVNTLFLQVGPHPSPLFGTSVALPAASVVAHADSSPALAQPSPLPRSRPAEAEMQASDATKPAVSSGASAPHVTQAHAAASTANSAARSDPLANLIISSQRVVAVQRALTDYGYGQIRPTGTVGPDTQAAIQKFERERKMPVTGQISEKLVHELGVATGRALE